MAIIRSLKIDKETIINIRLYPAINLGLMLLSYRWGKADQKLEDYR